MNFFVVFVLMTLSATCLAQSGSYDALIQQGKTALSSNQAEEALSNARDAIKHDQNRWEAYALAGGASIALKRCADAVDYLTDAIARAPAEKRDGLKGLLRQCVSVEAGPSASLTSDEKQSASSPPTQSEILLWKSIEQSQNVADYEAYLRKYPRGTYATLAQARVQQLQESRAVAQRAAGEESQRKAAEALEQGVTYAAFLASAWHLKSGRLNLSARGLSLGEFSGHIHDCLS